MIDLSIYVATSTRNHEAARKLVDRLCTMPGPYHFHWSYPWPWHVAHATTGWGGEDELPDVIASRLAEQTLRAAVDCDVFVLLVDPEHTMRGAWCELGARLASGHAAHVIGQSLPFFGRHPAIVRHPHPDTFVAYAGGLGGFEGATP